MAGTFVPLLAAREPTGAPRDRLGRPVHDLRISVTDRCNFRCVYCMPKEVFGRDFAFLPRELVLTFEGRWRRWPARWQMPDCAG